MGALATRDRERRFGSADEFRAVLGSVLSELDADADAGPAIQAAKLALCLRVTDLGVALSVRSASEPGHHLHWDFDEPAEPPSLELEMDSAVANAYLQGEESLAVALARGRMRCTGDPRWALVSVPALRLVVGPYRRLVRERFPHLALV